MAAGIASASDGESELPLVLVAPPGPRSRELALSLESSECPAFVDRRRKRANDPGVASAPIVLARGRGSNLFDVDDNRYVDLAAGFGAAILGHGPSAAHDAAVLQASTLAQGLGDLYPSDVKVELMARLASLFPAVFPEGGAKVMLCQSGADAVTAALKTAALASGRPGIVAFEGAYHGLSYAPLAACGFRDSFREPFSAQLNAHVSFFPYPRSSAQAAAILPRIATRLARGDVGALLVEPVLGRGGVVVPPPDFLSELARLARSDGALLIADEIWTGMGRSGSLLRSAALGLTPDLVCLGKGLGASFPISACIGSRRAMDAWARGGEVLHTSTHAGAPLPCAAALAALDRVAQGELALRAQQLGDELREALQVELSSSPLVREVRGAGLLIGVELDSGARGAAVSRALLERGYVVTSGGLAGEVLVVTPPLTIGRQALLSFAPTLSAVLSQGRA